MHPAVVIGVIIDAFLVVAGWSYAPVLGMIMAGSWVVSAIGLVLMWQEKYLLGRRVLLVGSLAFIPIGFVAVWGATSTLDRVTEREYQARKGAR